MRDEHGTGVDRRAFLRGGAALVAAGAAASCLPDVEGTWQEEGAALCTWSEPSVTPPAAPGRVVEAYDEGLVDITGYKMTVVPKAIPSVMQEVLLALTGAVDLAAAWHTLMPTYQKGQIVGIKVNVLNKNVPTNIDAVRSLIDLLKAGLKIPGDDIVVWDRRLAELHSRGFTPEALGTRVEATLEDRKGVGTMRGYELDSTCIAGRKTHLSKLLTRRVDHLINFAIMKNHDASGFTGCLKNNYGVIDNPGEFHDRKQEGVLIEDRFGPTIPAINALNEVQGKTCLWLMDALIGVCRGNTDEPGDCAPKRLLASLDPVAIDTRGRQLRDEERKKKGLSLVETTSQGWLERAERVGLGSMKIDTKIV